ncbi:MULTISPECIES: RNA polymerase sigma factor [unclassified Flavobacterium]|uniref:RNA polymerase sigma factor n=1 Tax=unclassified Flavobacterium TaxID=196869 RepID=UPI001F132A0D|nr:MULTISPECIES: sigma-70 family RNA polymerase sigma factor [unclassified Flavobacterium]UMY64798.1 sigma-70 family RNA polymerase sigma factor [Flavobacterium sp. HJ-32-4]HLN95399.1 sigma-70 family RNA polymerase sigma factor [Flavobacterium sp.]
MADETETIAALLDPATREQAFRRLIDETKRPLYGVIRKIVLDHDDTDDVLQNTYVKMYRALPSFKGESRLFTWMYRIATNEALSFIRERSRRNGIRSSEYLDQAIVNLKADSYFEGDEMALLLQAAVATLPEKQRLVFQLKYFQELKYEEIAEITGTSVGALKASYFHAVKKIEDYVTKH